MAMITEELPAIMAIDQRTVGIDFEGRAFSWRGIASSVKHSGLALAAMVMPAAAVVRRGGRETITAELMPFLRSRLLAHRMLSPLLLVSGLPRTPLTPFAPGRASSFGSVP